MSSLEIMSRLAIFPIKGKAWRDTLSIDQSSPKTIVIFGTARGGTTMVARVVQSLGIYLGDDIGINCEDDAFNLQQLQLFPKKQPDELKAALCRTIESRNQAHETWGWKYPNAALYLPLVMPVLRNPRFICVFRDCVTTSSRTVGPSVKNGQNPYSVYEANLNLQMQNLRLMRESTVPSCVCSYEKAVNDPRNFVKTLAGFLGVTVNRRVMKGALEQIAPGGYLKD